MLRKPSLASLAAPILGAQILGTQVLRMQTIPLIHQVLENVGLAEAVDQLCRDEGDVPVHKIVEALIHSRLQSLKPVPLSHIQDWFGKSVLPQTLDVDSEKVNEFRVGRVLELVAEVAPVLWIELVKRAWRAYPFDLDLMVYDTSSWYFEGEYTESEIVKFGYSRDGKSGCKQVNIGLDVTEDCGVPLMYNLLPGNVEDSTTVAGNLEQMRGLFKQLGVPTSRLQMLGDRALLNIPKFHLYKQAKVDVIGSMKACDFNDKLMQSVDETDLLAHPLPYVAERNENRSKQDLESEKYHAVRIQFTVPACKEVAGSEPFTAQALVVLGAGKKRLDEQHRETLLRKTEARLEEIQSHLNTGRYKNEAYALDQVTKAIAKYPLIRGLISYELKVQQHDGSPASTAETSSPAGTTKSKSSLSRKGKSLTPAPTDKSEGTKCGGTLALIWSRNTANINAAKKQDGRYVVYFTRESLSNDEVFQHFKNRDCVEKRVDQVKGPGPVVLRPVYLHKDQRIRGLVFVCMVAALASSLTEWKVRTQLGYKATGEGIQSLFQDFGASLQTFSDHSQILTMPRTSKWQDRILDCLGVQLPVTTVVTVQEWKNTDPASEAPPPWMLTPAPEPKSRGD